MACTTHRFLQPFWIGRYRRLRLEHRPVACGCLFHLEYRVLDFEEEVVYDIAVYPRVIHHQVSEVSRREQRQRLFILSYGCMKLIRGLDLSLSISSGPRIRSG